MTTMITEVYDAFRKAGTPDAEARAAAQALAHFRDEPRLAKIEANIAVLQSDVGAIRGDIKGIKDEMKTMKDDLGQIHVLKWMTGTLIIAVLGVLGRLLFIPT